ncbi:tail fiber domain-containing protein [Peredibacter starrii]|uniref:Tail fiber domain-containing protein n=1 Tax=Peredibacter starrii TaxID=28202 RepID=A0AAX4HLJ4_9BACT|nr:tail fiber domain-containing protein [Peredibacter starrii]WPU64040.1 tail fiber domain-containing protein [Peredibacter starrii]
MGTNGHLKKLFLSSLVVVIMLTSSAFAESLSYSGRLVNTNGSPVVGPVNLKFDIASTADTSTILCSQQIANVALTNGVFHVKLDLNCGASTLSQVLGAIVAPDSAAIRVTNETASKAYSFQSLHAVPSAQIAHGLSKLNANNNEVLTWTGSKWEPKPVTGATGGTVTDITAGSGLSGGTITNSGTIAIANGGVTDTHLAGNIARSKIANGTANYVLMNNGSGGMSEVAQLPLAQGGTGSSTAAGARTNLGLGDAAVATIGYGAGQVMPGEVPICLAHQKLQMNLGPTFWSCANDNDSLDATKLPLGGGTMSGAIDMGTSKIVNLGTPTLGTDAATKDYVDTKVGAAPGDNLGNHTATTNLAMGSNSITGVNKISVADGAWNSPSITFTSSPSSGLFHNGGILGFSAGGSLVMNLSSSAMNLNGSFAPYMRISGTNGESGPTYSFGGDSDTGMFSLSNNILGFTTGGVEKMRILATGEMAVGKTTAAGKLDVAGDIALDGKLKLRSDNTNFVELRAPAGLVGTLTYTFPASAGTSGYVLTTDGAGGLSWSQAATTATNVGGDLTGTIANAQIAAGAIYNADIANLTITYAKLNILDEEFPITKLSGTSDATKYLKGNKTWGTFLTDVLASPFATVTPSNTAIANGDTLQTVVNKTQGQINNLVTNSSNYLVKNGTDSITGTVTVNAATGALKIPTTPSGVDGTDAANVQYVKNYVGTFGQWTKTGSDLSYSAGNVGIGIASPWDQFMVYKANASTSASIVSDNTSTTAARYPSVAVKNFGGGGAGAIGNPTVELVNLRGNSSTTAPLKSGDSLGSISFHGSTNAVAAYKSGADIRAVASQDFTTTATGSSLIFATTANSTSVPADRMTITNAGDVAIGIAAPLARLHVKQAVDTTAGGLLISNTTAGGNTSIYVDSSHQTHIGGSVNSPDAIMIKNVNGNVGVGIAPLTRLHVGGGDSDLIIDGVTPISIHRSTSYPATPGMVVGGSAYVSEGSGTSTNFWPQQAGVFFYAGEVHSATNKGTGISLGTTSNGSTTAVERMTILPDGRVGIGTTAPTGGLTVNSSVPTSYSIISNRNSATGGQDWRWYSSSTGAPLGADSMCFGLGACLFILRADGNATLSGTLTQSSDIRFKRDITSIPYALDAITKLDGVNYYWKDESKGSDKQIGLIAQNVEKVFPEAVKTDKQGMKSVAYQNLVAPIINAIKEIRSWMLKSDEQTKSVNREIASLKAENAELKARDEKREREMAVLKAYLCHKDPRAPLCM